MRIPLNRSLSKQNPGFTLIELLIVVAIIAILAAIAVPNFLEAQTRAKVSRVKADLRTIATGMETYRIDNNKYLPTFNGNFTPPWGGGTRVEQRYDRFHYLTSPVAYLNNIIYDPFRTAAGANDVGRIIIIWSPPVWMLGTLPGSQKDVNYGLQIFKEQDAIRTVANDYNNFFAIFSAGPDSQGKANGDYDVNDPERASLGVQTYDATNGTVSDGDVFRTNGGDV